MRVKVSQEDLNRGRLVEPGLWYPCEVVNVSDAPTKAGDSTNTTVEMMITSGEFKGVVVYRLFNEKAPGFWVPYFKAFGIEMEPDQDYDPEATKGRQLQCFIQHSEFQGRKRNDVVDFRPI